MYGLKRVLFSENIPLLLYHCWAKVFCFIASFLRIFFSFTYWCLLFVLVLLNTIMIFLCEDIVKKGFKSIIRFDISEPLSALLFCSEIDVSIMQTDISIVQFLQFCIVNTLLVTKLDFRTQSHTSSSRASRFFFFSFWSRWYYSSLYIACGNLELKDSPQKQTKNKNKTRVKLKLLCPEFWIFKIHYPVQFSGT